MHHLEIDRFAVMKSPVHAWDPRIKIPVLLITAFTIGLLEDIRMAAIALGFSIGLVAVSRIPIPFIHYCPLLSGSHTREGFKATGTMA